MKKKITSFFIPFILAAFVQTGFAQEPHVSLNLPNFKKVNDNLYRGGEPNEAGIAELKRLGIKTVIDIGNGTEDSVNERKWVESAGMRYVNIHLHNWFKSSRDDVDAVLAEIEKAENQPVFLHCRRGKDRAGTVIAVYRMKHDGLTSDEALAEAKKSGMGWWHFWMRDFVNDYYRDRIQKK